MHRKLLVLILPILLSGILFYFTCQLNSCAESDSTGLIVSVRTDKIKYLANENVSIIIKVTNTGDNDVILGFVSSQIADFEILTEYNERVFYWSFDKAFLDTILEKTISPGKTEEFLNTIWNQTDLNYSLVPSGNYSIIGWVAAWDNWIYSKPVTIQISNNQPMNDSNLKLTISTDKKSYDVSHDVEVTIMATNTGAENISLVFPNSGIADYEILNENRKRVYFWSYNRLVQPYVIHVIIPVGKTIKLMNDTWDSNYTEGNYSLRAWLPLEPRLYSEYDNFQIHSNLIVDLSTNKLVYEHNESVNILLHVTNTGQEDKLLEFGSPHIADFEILNEHGDRVYLWSYDKGFIQLITKIMVFSGVTIEFLNATWDQKDNNGTKVPPGNYTIIGWTHDKKLKLASEPVKIQIKSEPSKPTVDIPPNVILRLSTDKSAYGEKEKMNVMFKLTNNNNKNVTLEFPYIHIINFEILNEQSEQVFLLYSKENYGSKKRNITFSPGENEIFRNSIYAIPFGAGIYSVRGWLLVDSEFYSNTVPIKVFSFNLTVTLSTNKTTYLEGESVVVTIKVKSNTKNNITLTFGTPQHADFIILNSADRIVYQWSNDKRFIYIETELSLPPEKNLLILNTTWPANVPKGEYKIKGWLSGTFKTDSNTVTIKVNDPIIEVDHPDPDHDLLTNLEEFFIKTDPWNPDTDDDGLMDGSEVTLYGTDPLNRDTDEDGYSDGLEVDHNTDPLNKDEYPFKSEESSHRSYYSLFTIIGIIFIITLFLLGIALNIKWKKKK